MRATARWLLHIAAKKAKRAGGLSKGEVSRCVGQVHLQAGLLHRWQQPHGWGVPAGCPWLWLLVRQRMSVRPSWHRLWAMAVLAVRHLQHQMHTEHSLLQRLVSQGPADVGGHKAAESSRQCVCVPRYCALMRLPCRRMTTHAARLRPVANAANAVRRPALLPVPDPELDILVLVELTQTIGCLDQSLYVHGMQLETAF